MMGNVTVEILKAMLEAGLEKIKAMEEVMAPSTEPAPEVEAKPKKTKKKAATPAPTPTTDSAETAEESTPESAPAEEAKTAVESEGKEVTLEQIRAVLQEKRAKGKKDKFKALFESFGVQRLPDVNPADYGRLLSAAEAL